MQLKVYRQSSKERDGRIIYKGEDARPYVDDKCFFVADGLGGASAIRHTKFKPSLFDENQMVSVMFGDVFGGNIDSEFAEYIKQSFSEFLSLKDCYFDNIYNIKKSGYFASRIVSTIFLYEVKHNEIFSDSDKLFDIYLSIPEVEKNNYLKIIGNILKEAIQTKIKMVSRNAGFVYESSFAGLALLGTTLCATLYREKDNSVQAFYFVAGDSRPYMWNADGLYQITSDQESSDGGLTNYIQATEGKDFYIDCRYMEFTKPCILFNATDGCFDSSVFISQMAFEMLLLNAIVESDNMGEVESKLTEFFIENGRHDDSSTIALATFGFESYEQLKETAKTRMDQLNYDFLADMPELLEYDFNQELDNFRKDFIKDVNEIKAYLTSEFDLTEKTVEQDVKTTLTTGEPEISIDNEEQISEQKAAEQETAAIQYNAVEQDKIIFSDLSEDQVINIVIEILSDNDMQLTEEQQNELTSFIDMFNELKRVENIRNKQQELFNKYDEIYYSLIKVDE